PRSPRAAARQRGRRRLPPDRTGAAAPRSPRPQPAGLTMPTISSFFGLETTLRGLLAQQSALDVTSHNIANANTPGYSRQQAVPVAADALQVTDGTRTATLASLGTGVQVESYSRIRDQFLDLQYRAQNMVLGQQSATSNSLSQVETALSEPGQNGIAAEL